jgi:endonuclease/exonuclease/phosphatase family metal-dependent hydrolase
MPEMSLASVNVHSGVDTRGRDFDVVEACASLDADVLVLQESWQPDGEDESTAARVADRLGYRLTEQPMARTKLHAPIDALAPRVGSKLGRVYGPLLFEGEDTRGARRAHQGRPYRTGRWGVAVLTRVPVLATTLLPLGKLRGDYAQRVAIRCDVDIDGRQVAAIGTHMSHLTQGSPLQYLRLRKLLPPPTQPGVLAGDMNLWGPPVSAAFPGWRRAVRGRTWPAARPHSQLDHVLVTGPVTTIEGEVAPDLGSDHRAVRVVLSVA